MSNNIFLMIGIGLVAFFVNKRKVKATPIIEKPIPIPDSLKEPDVPVHVPSPNPTDISYDKSFIETFIETAEQYLEVPYILGGNYAYNNSSGVDCSGLIMITLWDLGLECPDLQAYYQSTGEYWFGKNTYVIPKEDLKRGDLIYYDWQLPNPSTDTDHLVVDHCGIYVGQNKVLEASGSKVQYREYDEYRRSRVHTVRRLKGDGGGFLKKVFKDIKGYF